MSLVVWTPCIYEYSNAQEIIYFFLLFYIPIDQIITLNAIDW